jgi:CBS domain-containing protein
MTDIGAVLRAKGSDVATIGTDATLADVAAELAQRRIGALVVLAGGGEVAGIVSERDLVQCLAEHGAEALGQSVESAMTAEVITAPRDLPVLTALAVMTQRRVRHLPVTDGSGRLAGIVSIGDLVKHRMERIEAEADAMRAYIQSA